MPAPRFATPLACLTLMIAAASPAVAQDYAWQGFAAADAMNTLHNLLNRTNEAAQERRDRAAGRRPAATRP